MPYARCERLADQIYRVIARACCTAIADPRIEGVQITGVRLTKDLRTARIYFHMLDASSVRIEGARRALAHASGFLKRMVAASVDMKYMPTFEYFYDETADVSEHIEEIFEELKRKDRERGMGS